MGQHGNAILLGGLGFVLGALVGVGGSVVLSSPSESDETTSRRPAVPGTARQAPSDSAEDGGELAAAVVELRMTLASLQGVLERAAATSQTAPHRTPVGEGSGSAVDSRELAASIESLAAALRTMPGGGSSGTSSSLVIPGWIDRRAAFDTSGLRELYRTDDDGQRTEAATKAWRAEHLFWSRQDVLDRYGKPDDVYHDNGFVVWCYLVHGKNEVEDIDFSFDEGSVATVQYEFDWEE